MGARGPGEALLTRHWILELRHYVAEIWSRASISGSICRCLVVNLPTPRLPRDILPARKLESLEISLRILLSKPCFRLRWPTRCSPDPRRGFAFHFTTRVACELSKDQSRRPENKPLVALSPHAKTRNLTKMEEHDGRTLRSQGSPTSPRRKSSWRFDTYHVFRLEWNRFRMWVRLLLCLNRGCMSAGYMHVRSGFCTFK